MSKFIQHIAQFISTEYEDLSKLVIILPSQRAQKYIQDALFNHFQKPFFSPKFITLDAWVKELSPKKIESRTALLFELYSIYSAQTKEKETFESFINWGELLLNDFDEIDRYLVNAKEIFCNLRDIKEIENWSFNSTELSENQKKFLVFWENIEPYYTIFNSHLNNKLITYTGAALKELNEHIDSFVEQNKQQQFLFVGFNALSPVETNIIKQLVNRGKATCIVEADDFFLKDQMHEAGHFLRQIKQKIPEIQIFSSNEMLESEKQIELINCSERTSQSKVAYAVLSEFSQHEIENTLLLLTDETLIVPTIKNLPSNIKEANITLGLPLKYTHLKTWINLIFNIQEHAAYFKTNAAYHKDILTLLNNSLFQKITSEKEKDYLHEWQKKILSNNHIFSSINDSNPLNEKTQKFMNQLFNPWKNWVEGTEIILSLNEFLFSKLDAELDLLERSALFQFDKSIRELLVLMKNGAPEMTLSSFKNIFNRHWTNKSVAYYGNPTSGLQIMGLLETRMLSFENIIVLGLNEGSMPPTNPIQTIIPMDLRRYHKMPTPGDKEALFAHHFYRILPEARRLWITYFDGESSFGSEPSRYVKQIELEWGKINSKIQLKKKNFQIQLNEIKRHEGVYQTDNSKNALKRLFANGLSASAINKFLTCPLDFYYRYLLGLYENDEVEEEVESSTFGSFVHEVLEKLYTPFLHKQVLPIDVNKMIQTYPFLLEEAFLSHFNQNKIAFSSGKNQLSYQMANYHIGRYLKFEKNLLEQYPEKKLIIHALEKQLELEFCIDFDGEEIPIKIKGLVDRIDQWENETRIIDYKTGTCKPPDVKFKLEEIYDAEFEDLKKELNKTKYGLQLGIYALLFNDNNTHKVDSCSILSFVQLNEGYQFLDLSSKDATNNLSTMMKVLLKHIALKMLSLEKFIHEKESKYCAYCMK